MDLLRGMLVREMASPPPHQSAPTAPQAISAAAGALYPQLGCLTKVRALGAKFQGLGFSPGSLHCLLHAYSCQSCSISHTPLESMHRALGCGHLLFSADGSGRIMSLNAPAAQPGPLTKP